MNNKIVGLVAISVLLSAVLVMATSSTHLAEAKTSKQSPQHKFSKWYKQVCGADLCAEKAHLKTVKRIGNSGPNNN